VTRSRDERRVASLTHGSRSELRVRRVATVQKRRLLRQVGLRASDLDGVGLALLDTWARAQAKVELLDTYAETHGFLDEEGHPPSWAAFYFAALNSTRLTLVKLAEHLKARGKGESMVLALQAQARGGQVVPIGKGKR
jgi:hypothetical protein